ncbi:MAG: hypothetical protein COV47_00700 [Candidatus Diapherotrites archaeon CG11_big_fil_rev_8_21_14_0_20_37_9]|nr:MAG: hypothetical protein COV47_00700 [Candidatus Diapherotrites archaeon CG11_big_fil_rev_8_21_14_0_20_37_9]
MAIRKIEAMIRLNRQLETRRRGKGANPISFSNLQQNIRRKVSAARNVLNALEIRKAGLQHTNENERLIDGLDKEIQAAKKDFIRAMEENVILKRENSERLVRDQKFGLIYNYEAFKELAFDIIRKSKERKTGISFGMLDIDDFKKFNNRFNYATGDEVIKAIVKSAALRMEQKGVVIGKFGGDEYFFVGNVPEKDLINAMEFVRSEVSKALASPPNTVKEEHRNLWHALTLSGGVHSITNPSLLESMRSNILFGVLKDASNEALHHAKQKKNTISIYSSKTMGPRTVANAIRKVRRLRRERFKQPGLRRVRTRPIKKKTN